MSGELHVQNLGKSYRQWGSEWRRVASWFTPAIRPREEHWVLKDVSFSIGPGEAVGIVGQNGAGKSTLLKLITGTTRPTQGGVRVRGRVAAILELGMGFNPDLTGRQNAYHSAGLMGHSQTDIERAMPEIEAFAEVGEHFDQPIRTYSSGMQMRVAFAVATAFRPDVLIVDEALAVGDAFFQVKSFARINEFKRLGTTILFVSHDVGSVKTLCDRAILLSEGRIERDGNAVAVSDYYTALITSRLVAEHIVQDTASGFPVTRSGTREVEVVSVRVVDAAGEAKEAFFCGERARVEVCVEVMQPIPKLVQGFLLRDRRGNDVYGTNTFHLDKVIVGPEVGVRYRIGFDFDVDLAEGVYSVSVASVNSDTVLWQSFDWIENVAMFRVIRATQPFFIGVASLEVACEIDVVVTPAMQQTAI